MIIFIFSTKLNFWNTVIINEFLTNEKITIMGIYFSQTQGGDKGFTFKLKRLWNYGLINIMKIIIQKIFYKSSKQKSFILQCQQKIIDQKINIYRGNDFNSCLNIASELADISILVYFNKIVKKKYITDDFQIINIHPGNLPEYKGVQPVFWALLKNENEINVTIHLVDSGIDTGPIYKKISVPIISKSISDIMFNASLEVATIICPLLIDINGGNLKPLIQNKEAGRYYSRPLANDIKKFFKSGNRFF